MVGLVCVENLCISEASIHFRRPAPGVEHAQTGHIPSSFQNNLNVLAGFNTDLRYVIKFTRPIKVRKLWLLLLKKKQQKCINISYFSSFFVKILIVSVQNHTWCV